MEQHPERQNPDKKETTQELTIRPAAERDIPALAAIEQACFADPWSVDAIRQEILDNRVALLMVAQLSEEVVGYMGIWLLADEGHITNMAVLPAHRNKKIAKTLLEATLRLTEARGIACQTLEVRISNGVAQRLYRKAGFQETALRRNYYKDGEDAIIMWRNANRE